MKTKKEVLNQECTKEHAVKILTNIMLERIKGYQEREQSINIKHINLALNSYLQLSCNYMFDILDYDFDWSKSKEGYDYWCDVYQKLEEN